MKWRITKQIFRNFPIPFYVRKMKSDEILLLSCKDGISNQEIINVRDSFIENMKSERINLLMLPHWVKMTIVKKKYMWKARYEE